MNGVRTIRQAIKDSLDITSDSEIVFDDETIVQHDILGLPIKYVFTNMAAILYMLAAQFKRKKVDRDILNALNGNDYLMQLQLHLHLEDFLREWLEQDALFPDSPKDFNNWYTMESMVAAWNKHFKEDNE